MEIEFQWAEVKPTGWQNLGLNVLSISVNPELTFRRLYCFIGFDFTTVQPQTAQGELVLNYSGTKVGSLPLWAGMGQYIPNYPSRVGVVTGGGSDYTNSLSVFLQQATPGTVVNGSDLTNVVWGQQTLQPITFRATLDKITVNFPKADANPSNFRMMLACVSQKLA